MQEKLFNMIMDGDEVSWQSIIYDLVRTEKMDPWDIEVSLLAKKFIEKLKTLKEMDFRVSGKVVLAAAILLRIKTTKLLNEDLTELDRLIAGLEQTEEEFYDELEQEFQSGAIIPGEDDDVRIVTRTPQPRKRKVSVYDLVEALNKALEVQHRRPPRVEHAPEVKIPEKVREMSVIIGDVYNQIQNYYRDKKGKLTFSQLIPSESKEDKVYTFIPLLHLEHQRKLNMDQEEHFGEIYIMLVQKAAEEAMKADKQ